MANEITPYESGDARALDLRDRPAVREMARSMALEEPRRPVWLWLTLALTVLVLGGGIGWAAVTEVDRVVAAPAVVRPTAAPFAVRFPEAAHIAEILVSEGDRLDAGDPLLVVTAAIAPGEREALAARLAELGLTIARLEAVVENAEPDFSAFELDFPGLVATQRALFNAEIESRDMASLSGRAAVDQREAELTAERTRLDTLTLQLPLLQEEVDAVTAEVEGGERNRLDLLIRRRSLAELAGSVADAEDRVAAAEAAYERALADLEVADARFAREALERASALGSERAALQGRLERLDAGNVGQTLTAPIEGVVVRLGVDRLNQRVEPSQILVEISPPGDLTRVEVRLPPDRANEVALGLLTRVRVTGVPGQPDGGFTGTVEYVATAPSADPDTGESYVAARVRLLDAVGAAARAAAPGAAADVRIVVDRSSLLATLFDAL